MVSALCFLALAQAQIPYADDIAKFKEMDRKNPPSVGQVLFIGSSSFTRWTDAQKDLPNHKILNRAFGGSTLVDLIRWYKDIVPPYHPKQVVIYCGENDLAGDPKLSANAVVDRFKTLFGMIRKTYPKVPVAYVSMKPSPSRWSLRAKYIAGNRWIEEYLKTQPKTVFVDVWDSMLAADGRPKPEIFVEDRLHMNAKGYAIWVKILDPILL